MFVQVDWHVTLHGAAQMVEIRFNHLRNPMLLLVNRLIRKKKVYKGTRAKCKHNTYTLAKKKLNMKLCNNKENII